MSHQVVAHFLDGSLVKGSCLGADPARPGCHVESAGRGVVEVHFADLKALFFVRSLAGDPAFQESNAFSAGDSRRIGARSIELSFLDGEVMRAFTARYPPGRNVFFVFPADPRSNNERVLVNGDACRSIRPVA